MKKLKEIEQVKKKIEELIRYAVKEAGNFSDKDYLQELIEDVKHADSTRNSIQQAISSAESIGDIFDSAKCNADAAVDALNEALELVDSYAMFVFLEDINKVKIIKPFVEEVMEYRNKFKDFDPVTKNMYAMFEFATDDQLKNMEKSFPNHIQAWQLVSEFKDKTLGVINEVIVNIKE